MPRKWSHRNVSIKFTGFGILVKFTNYLREVNFRVDIFLRMTQTQIFRVDKFSRMLVNIDTFFQGNEKNDSFMETYAWNKAWRSNTLIKITRNEITNKKKRFLLFVFNISYSKKTLLVADMKTDFVSGLIVSLIVFNKYIQDITTVIFRIRTIII